MSRTTLGFALTWDGARWPANRLPKRARAFLAPSVSPARAAAALRAGKVGELRICWVPRLKGGTAVLCDPFVTPEGKRISFRIAKTVKFGEVLGVVYGKSRKRLS
jgi:hypothetical protein